MVDVIYHKFADRVTAARDAVLDARNAGLSLLDNPGPAGEAARLVEAMYWQLEHAHYLAGLPSPEIGQ